MSALDPNAINIGGGQAGLGLIVIFCIAAIRAAAGPKHNRRNNQNHDNRKEG
jgi:hypothetical protein